MLQGAEVSVAPLGIDHIEGSGRSHIDGDLNAPAGTVSITGNSVATSHWKAGATISAAGYNVPGLEPVMRGYPVSYNLFREAASHCRQPMGR